MMKKNTCFELPSSRGVQKCIVYPLPGCFEKKFPNPPIIRPPLQLRWGEYYICKDFTDISAEDSKKLK